MAINRFTIESYMEEMELKYFSREDDSGAYWELFFAEDLGVMVRLMEEGEFLIVRSLPLAILKQLPDNQQANLVKQLLKRNDGLKLGHYSADDKIVFETSVPVEDGEFTANQFRRCFGVVTSEISTFPSRLEAMCNGVDPGAEMLESLMQRLFEGGRTSE